MKITSVEIHPSSSSDPCVLSFRDPSQQNPYNVKMIVGLDADEIMPRFYGVPGSGTPYYNLSLGERVIVARIELNPRWNLDETPSTLRDNLLKMIGSSRTGLVQMQFKDEADVVAAISGFITKFETPLFSEVTEVQLTITCDDPWLRALTRTDVPVAGLAPTITNVPDVKSTAPHGFIFEMEVVSAESTFYIGDPGDTEWGFEVTPAGGFLVGDVIHFSSEHNNKYLYLTRGFDTVHLVDVILPGSVWPIMFPGDNNFAADTPTSFEWVSASYYPTYWGV